MNISQLLNANAVIARVRLSSKKQALSTLSATAGRLLDLDPAVLLERIMERERLGTTGFGGGCAIPHAKAPGLRHVTGVFASLSDPIDYGALDRSPVDLICLLLAPPDSGADHLQALACMSRLFRNQAQCERLRGAENADALYAVLMAQEQSQAA